MALDGLQQYSVNENNSIGFLGRPENTEQTKYILNTNDVLKEMENFLRGVRYNNKTNRFDPLSKPLLNREGIGDLLRELQFRLSRVFSLSNIEEEHVYAITLTFADVFIEMIILNKRKYNIEAVNIPMLCHAICDGVFVTLMKSKGGNYQEFLKSTSKTSEVHHLDNKRSWVPNIFKREQGEM